MKPVWLVAVVVLLLAAFAGVAHARGNKKFRLESGDFLHGQRLPDKSSYNGFDCHGDNISPELHWTNPPADAKSFALMVHDPDAPTGGAGIWHWVIINIPVSANHIEAGAGTITGDRLPAGSQQISTDYSMVGWGGPCPPKGAPAHRYNFTLYALKVERLDIPADFTASHVGVLIHNQSLARTTLSGTYSR